MISLNPSPTVYRHMEASLGSRRVCSWGPTRVCCWGTHVYVPGAHTCIFLGPTRVCFWRTDMHVPGVHMCLFLGPTHVCSRSPHVYVAGLHTCMFLGPTRVCSWGTYLWVPHMFYLGWVFWVRWFQTCKQNYSLSSSFKVQRKPLILRIMISSKFMTCNI